MPDDVISVFNSIVGLNERLFKLLLKCMSSYWVSKVIQTKVTVLKRCQLVCGKNEGLHFVLWRQGGNVYFRNQINSQLKLLTLIFDSHFASMYHQCIFSPKIT